MHLNKNIKVFCIVSFIIINLIFIFKSYGNFPGKKILYINLFVICNLYIFYSFNFSKLFLDKTLSIFLWLGFFYKLSIMLITDSRLAEGAGSFKYQPNQYDELLIFSIIGIAGFFISSIFFNKIIVKIFKLQPNLSEEKYEILKNFYDKKKKLIYILFFFLIIFITFINYNFGFYQKGLLPKAEINLYLGYIIKWMLLFGLTSISCLLIDYEIRTSNKIGSIVIFLFFTELLLTNLSLLSRSLIFTGSAVLFSVYINYENSLKKKTLYNSLIFNTILLLIIFSISIFPINKIRNYQFIDQSFIAEKIVENYSKSQTEEELLKKKDLIEIKNDDLAQVNIEDKKNVQSIVESNLNKEEKIKLIEENLESRGISNLDLKKNINRILFVIKNRFVGLDGVASVTSYPNTNINLLTKSLKEKFNPNVYGFYQRTFIIPYEQPHLVNQNYIKTSSRHYGIIIPGIISYLSYPGSKLFLFISISLIFIFCGTLEFIANKLTYNSILFSSLVGYVLGYRLIHFGYLPRQSYLLIGAIVLTIMIIYLTKKIIILLYEK